MGVTGDLRTGALQVFCGIAGVLSGFLLGYLADRHLPGMIAIYSALITGACMFSLTFAHSMFFCSAPALQ